MKLNPTQKNSLADEAKPAKKQWQKPDFYLLDTDDINGGPVDSVVEKTVNGKTAHDPAITGALTTGHHS